MPNDRSLPRHTEIVDAVLALQCEATGCRNQMTQWRRHMEDDVVPLWETHRPHVWAFVQALFRRFVARRGQFQDYQWDFMAALFDGRPCNCVCGTLYVCAVAEYLGLFPTYIYGEARLGHIWVAVRDDPSTPADEVHIVETTLPPDQVDAMFMDRGAMLRKPFYHRGLTHCFRDTSSLVESTLINESMRPGTLLRRTLLSRLRDQPDWASPDGAQAAMLMTFAQTHPTHDTAASARLHHSVTRLHALMQRTRGPGGWTSFHRPVRFALYVLVVAMIDAHHRHPSRRAQWRPLVSLYRQVCREMQRETQLKRLSEDDAHAWRRACADFARTADAFLSHDTSKSTTR